MKWIQNYLPWLLSAISIYTSILAGNRHPKTWILGLLNQGLWLIWIFLSATWGLLPMNLALWLVYLRNHLKWKSLLGKD